MNSPASSIAIEELDSLWLMLRDGDRNGLEGLYRYFSKQLFRYGLSIVPDQDFVQDCIQDVFIDLWKYHKNLQKADNVKIYLFKSLSHKIFRENKKEGKWKKEEITDKLEVCFFTESIESDLIGIQRDVYLQKKLAFALNDLPDRQKEVIQYLFFENFSYEEVSKMMGINLRSVYTLAWKAISNLKKLIL
ncbi:sigma-70 family RNA polymerase sigma factor [Algoriphagus sp. C2-6-M1]|uniref:RNA polymerase sigma factor n=1 Tax=Algoriphagus persicinus TaxID=3108754 RepID=UPI002B3B68E3|nr:sigma-70 family RNA polymerase sigma factor [Algoriphagus sp. C2-6-M1]MEB2782837.1 sigma-70 family RNA polymerase sigma factor [Algoriphagus sp. C2-6-M1]